jgi:glycosyltransferase involved in cell wall biosynthesis
LKSKKSIVLINQDSGYLMIDIVNHICENYDETTLIAGKLIERGTKLNDKVGLEWITEYKRNSLLSKFFSWFLGFFQALYLIGFKYKAAELFIVSNPPFAVFIPLFFNRRFKLLIFDIYPDVLVNSISWFKYTPIAAGWRQLNKIIFKRAEKIYTIGEGLKATLEQYVNSDKIEVVPLWTNNDFIYSIPRKNNIFLKEKSFENNFIVLYSGNLGKTQHPEIIIELAKWLKSINDLHFVIIGSGSEKNLLEDRIKTENIHNVSMFNWQDPSLLPHTFSSAHIAIITSGSQVNNLSIPSKTFNFMSVGVPILGISSPNSELGKLIQKYKIGACFDSNEVKEISEFILKLKGDFNLYNFYAENSLKTSKIFTIENVNRFL